MWSQNAPISLRSRSIARRDLPLHLCNWPFMSRAVERNRWTCRASVVRYFATGPKPLPQPAKLAAVLFSLRIVVSAPASTSKRTIAILSQNAAKMRGVVPRLFTIFRLALCLMSSLTIPVFMSRRDAACSGALPLTSCQSIGAPLPISVLASSVLPWRLAHHSFCVAQATHTCKFVRLSFRFAIVPSHLPVPIHQLSVHTARH